MSQHFKDELFDPPKWKAVALKTIICNPEFHILEETFFARENVVRGMRLKETRITQSKAGLHPQEAVWSLNENMK